MAGETLHGSKAGTVDDIITGEDRDPPAKWRTGHEPFDRLTFVDGTRLQLEDHFAVHQLERLMPLARRLHQSRELGEAVGGVAVVNGDCGTLVFDQDTGNELGPAVQLGGDACSGATVRALDDRTVGARAQFGAVLTGGRKAER